LNTGRRLWNDQFRIKMPILPILMISIFPLGCTTDDDNGAGGSKTTVYDNFQPDWVSRYSGGWALAGKYGGNRFGVEQAMGFTPTQSGKLSDIWVGLSRGPTDRVKEVVFKISPDSGGRPGAVMESWSVTDSVVEWGQKAPPHHLIGTGKTNLAAGTSYWVWATAEDSTALSWNFHVEAAFTCPHTLKRDGQDWLPNSKETCSVFRVDVTR
jgi:hypothetical protein